MRPARGGSRRATLAIALVAALAWATSASGEPRVLDHVSIGPAGGNAATPAVFQGTGGGHVFFQTNERLVAADTDSSVDVYSSFGRPGEITLVSTGPSGGNAAFNAFFAGAGISGSQLSVIFGTAEKLTADDTDSQVDLYERAGGTTTRISTGSSGGNGAFSASFEDTFGDAVLFRTSERLEPADTDSQPDIYERSGGTTTLVSTGPAGGNGAFPAFFDAVTTNGVLFETDEQLVAGDGDGARDIYQRSGGTTTLVSTGPAGGNGAFDVFFDDTTSDGNRIYFSTLESLVGNDTDSQFDVYERAAGATTRISTGSSGGNGGFDAFFAGLSSTGQFVFFETDEPLEGDDFDDAVDVYRREGTTTTLISGGSANIDARFVATEGSIAAFETEESLVPADTDSAIDVYQNTPGPELVSTGPADTHAETDARFVGGVPFSRMFFETEAPMVAADTDSAVDVYERASSSTTLLSIGPAGGNGELDASFAGGQDLRVFLSTSERLLSSDTDSAQDVYAANAVPPGGHVRPQGASPLRVSLVPAFAPCTSPDSAHGAPLASPSCNPPEPASGELTVGTPDSNANPARSVGFARLAVDPGDVSTPADEADVRLDVSIGDVRERDDLSDYAGELRLLLTARITDRFNNGADHSATTQEIPFPATVVCATTADPEVGSTCALATTFDALVPGSVVEAKRAIWQLDQVEVYDGGPDGDAESADNTLFARQGVFVP